MSLKTVISSTLVPMLIGCSFVWSFNGAFAQNEKFKVVLDAGHGGADPGNVGNGFKEAVISLSVALEVGKILEKVKGIEVVYTRKTNVAVNLYDRPKVANSIDADLFVSIHCNSHHTQAIGTETFVIGPASNERNFEVAKRENEVIFLEENYEKNYEGFDPNSPESLIGLSLMQEDFIDLSIHLAELIEANFVNKAKRKSRGVKQSNFWVLHNTYMPSVLVEMGFLTNDEEGPFLNSPSGQSQMAVSIADAILKFIGELDYFVENDQASVIFQNSKKETKNTNDNEIVFKVQIASGSKKLKIKSKNFKGLEGVSVEESENIFRYYYGEYRSYSEAVKEQEMIKQKGYPSAFIVAYEKGVKIPIKEAIEATTN